MIFLLTLIMKYLLFGLLLLGLECFAFGTSECIAHRGNSSIFLENSLAALQSAAEVKAHGVEFDIRHTLDEQAIILHDEELQRVTKNSSRCPRKDKVNSLKFTDLRHCQLLNGEPIPTLETTLKILSNYPIKIFIEFKDNPTTADLLLIYKYYQTMPERVYFISFSATYLIWLRQEIHKMDIFDEATLLHLQSNYTLPTAFHGVNLQYNNITAINIIELKKQNKKVGVWTVDNPSDIKKFISLSVDFITTNYPTNCLNYL